MLYQSAHVTGISRNTPTSKALAVENATFRAMTYNNGLRYIVVEENTDNVVAVCWPDGAVDYLDKPYPKVY